VGNSDLTILELALGSWLTYGDGVERQQVEACVHQAFDVGINFIDTADVYAQNLPPCSCFPTYSGAR
jgi:1-deoxyxylulose-5-phosphate synthase